jgi:hypothetical protein
VVYPNVGGKLASLVHKPSGRELVFNNPVFQPGKQGLHIPYHHSFQKVFLAHPNSNF